MRSVCGWNEWLDSGGGRDELGEGRRGRRVGRGNGGGGEGAACAVEWRKLRARVLAVERDSRWCTLAGTGSQQRGGRVRTR